MSGLVNIIQTPDLWIEGTAVEQLKAVAGLDGVIEVVGLPDLQPGRGYPVGSVALTRDRLIPILIDKDIGCGMLFASFGQTRINAAKTAKKLSGRFFAWEGLPATGAQFRTFLEKPAAWPDLLDRMFPGSREIVTQHIARAYGVRNMTASATSLTRRNLSAEAVARGGATADLLTDESLEASARSVGTIGVGNHFIEIQKVAEMRGDPETAARFGIKAGDSCITIHTGSRSFGYTLAERIFWEAKETGTGKAIPPDSPLWNRYLAMMQAALNYAALNRLILLLRMLEYVGTESVTVLLDKPHNFAEILPEEGGAVKVVHRKGAAPAHFSPGAPDPVIIPGSMGNESWFCVAGEGVGKALNSVNHGVGRKWQRTVAAEKLQRKAQEKGMRAVTGKGEVICADPDHLYEEGGDAYKNVESVMACAEGAGLIQRVARLEPVLTMRE